MEDGAVGAECNYGIRYYGSDSFDAGSFDSYGYGLDDGCLG